MDQFMIVLTVACEAHCVMEAAIVAARPRECMSLCVVLCSRMTLLPPSQKGYGCAGLATLLGVVICRVVYAADDGGCKKG